MMKRETAFRRDVKKEPGRFLRHPIQRLKVYKEWAHSTGLFGDVYRKHARAYDILAQAQDARGKGGVWKAIKGFIPKKPGIIIDLAGGTGKYLPEMAQIGKKVYYIGPEPNEIEIANEHIHEAIKDKKIKKNNIEYYIGKLGEVTPKEKAEVVVCNYGFDIISQSIKIKSLEGRTRKAIEEIKKLVKPGGKIIISDAWSFEKDDGSFKDSRKQMIEVLKEFGKVNVKIIKNNPIRYNSRFEAAFANAVTGFGERNEIEKGRKWIGVKSAVKTLLGKKHSLDVCVISIELPKK